VPDAVLDLGKAWLNASLHTPALYIHHYDPVVVSALLQCFDYDWLAIINQ
jgi:hypothetical protein